MPCARCASAKSAWKLEWVGMKKPPLLLSPSLILLWRELWWLTIITGGRKALCFRRWAQGGSAHWKPTKWDKLALVLALLSLSSTTLPPPASCFRKHPLALSLLTARLLKVLADYGVTSMGAGRKEGRRWLYLFYPFFIHWKLSMQLHWAVSKFSKRLHCTTASTIFSWHKNVKIHIGMKKKTKVTTYYRPFKLETLGSFLICPDSYLCPSCFVEFSFYFWWHVNSILFYFIPFHSLLILME